MDLLALPPPAPLASDQGEHKKAGWELGGGQGRQSRSRWERLRASISRASSPWDLSGCLICPSSRPKVGRLTTCQPLPRVSSFPGSHGLGVCWDPSKWAEHSWVLMGKRSSHSDRRQQQRDPGLRSWPDLLPALGADSQSPLSYPQLLQLLSKALLRLTGLMRCDFLSGVSPPLAFTLTLV